jgi:hypothetical protein
MFGIGNEIPLNILTMVHANRCNICLVPCNCKEIPPDRDTKPKDHIQGQAKLQWYRLLQDVSLTTWPPAILKARNGCSRNESIQKTLCLSRFNLNSYTSKQDVHSTTHIMEVKCHTCETKVGLYVTPFTLMYS